MEQMQQMQQKMQRGRSESQAQIDFKVSAAPTGQIKQIAGYDAKEILVKMEVQGTGQQGRRSPPMCGLLPRFPEMRRSVTSIGCMDEKIAWAPGSNVSILLTRPDVAKGNGGSHKRSGQARWNAGLRGRHRARLGRKRHAQPQQPQQ
jgi:hypothetical protein